MHITLRTLFLAARAKRSSYFRDTSHTGYSSGNTFTKSFQHSPSQACAFPLTGHSVIKAFWPFQAGTCCDIAHQGHTWIGRGLVAFRMAKVFHVASGGCSSRWWSFHKTHASAARPGWLPRVPGAYQLLHAGTRHVRAQEPGFSNFSVLINRVWWMKRHEAYFWHSFATWASKSHFYSSLLHFPWN